MGLQQELKKKHGFDSLEQEATLSLLRTSDLLENRIIRLLRQYELTPSQYNVLRIVRGEGEPMPCLEVADRMIQVAPAITRVIDQLVTRRLVDKQQSDRDGRVYLVGLTAAGKRLLRKIDQPILTLHQELLGKCPRGELKELIRILATIRHRVSD